MSHGKMKYVKYESVKCSMTGSFPTQQHNSVPSTLFLPAPPPPPPRQVSATSTLPRSFPLPPPLLFHPAAAVKVSRSRSSSSSASSGGGGGIGVRGGDVYSAADALQLLQNGILPSPPRPPLTMTNTFTAMVSHSLVQRFFSPTFVSI
jgi:hypothetical protein